MPRAHPHKVRPLNSFNILVDELVQRYKKGGSRKATAPPVFSVVHLLPFFADTPRGIYDFIVCHRLHLYKGIGFASWQVTLCYLLYCLYRFFFRFVDVTTNVVPKFIEKYAV